MQTRPTRRIAIDTYLSIASVRVVREYSDRPVSDESLQRLLEAGRATGSSQNRQPWRFYIVRDRALREELSRTVFAPENIRGCQVAVALVTTAKSTFDVGRCVQNMVLAAWAEGIGSSPNGVREADPAMRLLDLPAGETITTILSFGYPAHPHTPRADDIAGILGRVKRKPLDELVVWVDGSQARQ